MRKLLSHFVIAIIAVTSLTACGGGSSTAEESFIEGSGAITKIDIKDRKGKMVDGIFVKEADL